ncbi:phospholipase-like protein [Tanacetum coccineum]|uniref:Phospholipase-like protein n=1 Tax=Tanacetum coccineum TaxID=301880 RepID=A0ABQ5AJ27_9ASTR
MFSMGFGSLSHLKDAIVGGVKIQMLYQEQLVGRKSLSLTDLIVVTFLRRSCTRKKDEYGLLLCSDTSAKQHPLFYANGDKYATPWSDVDQVFFPINEMAQHWCLAHFDIVSGLVTFYDSGDTYDYESRDFYVRVRECLKGTGSSRNL